MKSKPTQPAIEHEDYESKLWWYKAEMIDVVDGDTLDVMIDQGFHARRKERVRLLGVNAPEMTGKTKVAGQKAKYFVEELIYNNGWFCYIRTSKTDAFGRYLADVYWSGLQDSLSDMLIKSGHATKWSRSEKENH